MAENTQTERRPEPPAARASAMSELMDNAKALATLQQQAAMDAQRLPNPRLDEPKPGETTFLRDEGNGTFSRVKPDGEVVETDISAKEAQG